MFQSHRRNVDVIVPDRFIENYPKFIEFLKSYYEWMYRRRYTQNKIEQDLIIDQESTRSADIDKFIKTKDDKFMPISSVDNLEERVNGVRNTPQSGTLSEEMMDRYILNQDFFRFDARDQDFISNDGLLFEAADDREDDAYSWFDTYGFINLKDTVFKNALISSLTGTGVDPDEILATALRQQKLDILLFVKLLKHLYEIKGTHQSLKLFFGMIFDIDIEIVLPKEDIVIIDGDPSIDLAKFIRDDEYYDEFTVVIKAPNAPQPFIEIFNSIYEKYFGAAGFRYIINTQSA